MFRQLVKLFVAVLIAGALQMSANQAALAERGYEAMGSEIFAFPVVLLLEWKVFLEEREVEDDE